MNLGGGIYGETDRTLNLTIGPAKIATVDDATKIMTVTIDGQVARQFPVSMGRDESITVDGQVISFVTPSGIYVAQEKYDVKQMNSGVLRAAHQLRPRATTPRSRWPYGCRTPGSSPTPRPGRSPTRASGTSPTGASTCHRTHAQWFYDTFSYGDIVQVTGTSTQLAPDDGYGDWNIGLGPMAPRKRHLLTVTSVKGCQDELLRWCRCHFAPARGAR